MDTAGILNISEKKTGREERGAGLDPEFLLGFSAQIQTGIDLQAGGQLINC